MTNSITKTALQSIKLDLKLGTPISFEDGFPGNLAVDVPNHTLYVCMNNIGKIAVVDTQTYTKKSPIPLYDKNEFILRAVALSSKKHKLYITTGKKVDGHSKSYILPVDINSQTVGDAISYGSKTDDIIVSIDLDEVNNTLYVANNFSGEHVKKSSIVSMNMDITNPENMVIQNFDFPLQEIKFHNGNLYVLSENADSDDEWYIYVINLKSPSIHAERINIGTPSLKNMLLDKTHNCLYVVGSKNFKTGDIIKVSMNGSATPETRVIQVDGLGPNIRATAIDETNQILYILEYVGTYKFTGRLWALKLNTQGDMVSYSHIDIPDSDRFNSIALDQQNTLWVSQGDKQQVLPVQCDLVTESLR